MGLNVSTGAGGGPLRRAVRDTHIADAAHMCATPVADLLDKSFGKKLAALIDMTAACQTLRVPAPSKSHANSSRSL